GATEDRPGRSALARRLYSARARSDRASTGRRRVLRSSTPTPRRSFDSLSLAQDTWIAKVCSSCGGAYTSRGAATMGTRVMSKPTTLDTQWQRLMWLCASELKFRAEGNHPPLLKHLKSD